ncbi:MAG: S26 family signal peptidase, partial [Spirochaetaceae bacterium]|nr:S26 family signal peptidase [Spirochaetaceae bacterium]
MGRRQSYAEAVERRRRFARRAGILVFIFLCYEALSGLIVSVWAVKSESMDPTVRPGDRILATPLAFGPLTPFGKIPGIAKPRRVDLVIGEPGSANTIEGMKLDSDAIVRCAT